MTITEPPQPARRHRPDDPPRLDPVVEPRWIRTRRREAAWAAARRDALLDRILRQVAVTPTAGRPKTIEEILDEQGIRSFDPVRARRESGLTSRDWQELRAALDLERGR